MVVMKNKRYSKSKLPVLFPISPTSMLVLYEKLLRSFFTFIVDIVIDISDIINGNFHSIFNFSNDIYNFNNCYIYGNKD